MAPIVLELDAVLFDMDGTLISSTPAVNSVWTDFASKYGLDYNSILNESHGVQTIVSFRKYLPHLTEEERVEETKRFEAGIVPRASELMAQGKEGLEVLPGVRSLLDQLRQGPVNGWCIVTSATNAYASAALRILGPGLGAMPRDIITADDVSRGKPFPDPYLMGAKRLDVDISRCLVVEDAPAGALSGLAAGSIVLAVGTGYAPKLVQAVNPTYYVDDLSQVSAEWKDGKLFVTINQKD
ncbi:putative glycerol-1-phosphatase [Mrakia frigida]|uniref:putative glycerol-1-phosphatase n=1 Tax=Mrakia frigida TaxID=29902 RepID=UPI003FCBEE95